VQSGLITSCQQIQREQEALLGAKRFANAAGGDPIGLYGVENFTSGEMLSSGCHVKVTGHR
jgi:hypothetical protein